MDEIEYQLLDDFLGNNWSQFIRFLSAFEDNEEKAEETATRISEHLREKAGL